MTEHPHLLAALSEQFSAIVQRAAGSVVAVHGGHRAFPSGIHWRAGIVVTAEEVLDRDDDIAVTLPGGRRVPASLAGRDPTTDIAVLRFESDGLPVAELGEVASLRAGHPVFAVGNNDGGPSAAFGIVAYAGEAWESRRGGTIDHLIRLDLSLDRSTEGGALLDAEGRVLGMAVSGPRRRALAIPRPTIDRVVDQLLAKGRIARGYLGAGLQAARFARRSGAPSPDDGRGVLVVSIDADGPGARSGLLVGDIITAWNDKPVARVREVMRLLGPDSVGARIKLSLLRGGAPATLDVAVGERPSRER